MACLSAAFREAQNQPSEQARQNGGSIGSALPDFSQSKIDNPK